MLIQIHNLIDDDGTCTDNACCTSDYITDLRENIQDKVLGECVKDSFHDIIEIAEDFFDDFAGI